MEEKQIQLWKQTINYKVFSWDENNYSILILHWWGGKSDSWEEVSKQLSAKWPNIIVPDLPGFWKSEIISTYTLNDYAKIVEEFVKSIKLDNFILMWHSNGGAISIKIINRWYIKPLSLILNNSAWIRNDKKRSFKRKVLNKTASVLKPLNKIKLINKIRPLLYRAIWSQDYLKSEENPYLKETYKNMISSDLKNEISKIVLNTLLIWWENDTYTPVSDAYHMRENIKNSKLIILDNEKHWIHLQNPDRLTETIINNI